jgi:hypothetical protein
MSVATLIEAGRRRGVVNERGMLVLCDARESGGVIIELYPVLEDWRPGNAWGSVVRDGCGRAYSVTASSDGEAVTKALNGYLDLLNRE